MSSPIKCFFINVNSLVSRHKRHYLRLFLDQHKPDILMLAEHRLSPRHVLEFRGYSVFRQNRNAGRGGGTAILIRDSFRCERVALDLGNIENTCVRVFRSNGSPMTVVAAYLRPRDSMCIEQFDCLGVAARSGDVILGADFNARHSAWGGGVTDTKGRVIFDFLLTCPDLEIRPTNGPTRIDGDTRSYIDLIMVSSRIVHHDPSGNGLRTFVYESDHKAVEIVLVGNDLAQRERPSFYDYDRMDKGCFNRHLRDSLDGHQLPVNRNITCEEIDSFVNSLGTAFRSAIEYSTPKIYPGNRGLRRLPAEIMRFIDEKKRLRRIKDRTGDFARRNVLKADIRNLDRIIQGAIFIFEQGLWESFLQGIRVNSKTLRKVKAAAGICARRPIPDLVDCNDLLISDDLGKANLLADSIQGNGPDDERREGDDVIIEAANSVNNKTPTIVFDDGCTADGSICGDMGRWRQLGFLVPEDIEVNLKRRPNRKSNGPDGIPDVVLKKTNRFLWTILTILFNHCLNLGYFPLAWKESITVPIPKPGKNPRQCDGYRPISMLSACGKLLEKILLGRLWLAADDLGIPRDNQFGFKRGHSTSHALMALGTHVSRALNRRNITIAVSLDFARAFDSVWHDGIVYKLLSLGFDRNLSRIIADFLRNRTFRVRVGEVFSSARDVIAGVPQGSLLGPMLYNIFVSDIPLPPSGDLLLLYADDILVAASGACASAVNSRLNSFLEVLSGYFLRWRLRLNVAKCEGLIFKGKRKYLFRSSRGFIPTLRIGEQTIAIRDRFKYLGVIFQENFEFYRHIDQILAKVKGIFATYLKVMRCGRGLSDRVRLLIYKQIIRPIIAYAFPVWFGISSHQMERLRIWEARILASCLGLRPTRHEDGTFRRPSRRSIYNLVEFDRLDAFLVKNALKFLDRSSNLDNSIVRNCLEPDRQLAGYLSENYRPPEGLLRLDSEGLLFRDDRLLFYHRRLGTLDVEDTVYNTSQ